MFCIVAIDRARAIGKRGGMLVHLPGDLRYFKEQTLGKTVVMGHNTLRSLPASAPLKGRRNIVLTRQDITIEGAEICHSIEELLSLLAGERSEDVAVIGGGTVYAALLPYCEKALVTEIDAHFEGADTYFPALDGFRLSERSAPQTENGVSYTFCTYVREPSASI